MCGMAFQPLPGDRSLAEDPAVVTAHGQLALGTVGRFHGQLDLGTVGRFHGQLPGSVSRPVPR